VDRAYGVYVNDSFNRKLFAKWLAAKGIPWPRLESGSLALDQEVFKSQAEAYPILAPLRELTLTLAQMRSTGLTIGADGRNRFWTRPLLSKTGRNQPSTSANILGSAAWLRGLITPPPGHGLALIDWSAQEIAIAAGRSGDPARK
jgi:DNA polymerase I